MSDVLKQIQALESQRAQLNADIDKQLEGLRAQALQELEVMQRTVAELSSALSMPVSPVPKSRLTEMRARVADPMDETDAGNGVREIEENHSAQSFKDELADLRSRTQAKRRRLG